MFAPKYLENKLKFFPHIKEAVTFGQRAGLRVAAFINIDLEAVGNWAERQHAYSGYTDLAGQPPVYDLIRDCIEKVNADLAGDPTCGIADQALPHPAQGTRRRRRGTDADPQGPARLRRRALRRADRRPLFGSARTVQYIEAQVTYEDGRTGTIAATC
jgi:long-chain acyl-CoA synthetase